MAREVFIDTSGFYACLVLGDDKHAEAAGTIKSATGTRRFVTTDYVLDETLTLLKMRGHGHLIQSFTDITLASRVCRIEWMDPQRFESVHRFLLRHADHDYSFTDCFSFLVMKESNLREALTKDGHFREAGFRALLA